jgi:hypothetical protein
VLVNTTDASSGGFGNPGFVNINRGVLGGILAGTLTQTRDVQAGLGLPSIGIHAIVRDPISDAMNVMDYSVPCSCELKASQETSVNPVVDNPLNQTYTTGGSRQRAIHPGEEVTEVGTVADSFGYTFFSFPVLSNSLTTIKYLQLDGVDPLLPCYINGAVPACGTSVPFTHILDGSYAVWATLRVITNSPVPTGVASVIAALAPVDFVPNAKLTVFHSHFTQSSKPGHNGNCSGFPPESGGDWGGLVYTKQADLDSCINFGKEITGKHQ